MVTYRATLDLPDALVSWVEDLIGTRRCETRSPWRKLTSYDQAVMLLVRLAKGGTFAQLGAHFGVSTDTAWRYVSEGIALLAPLAPSLTDALDASGDERRLLLDGTLLTAWRCHTIGTKDNPDPLYSGKHKDHGLNVQALTSTAGDLLFLGEARPGSTHDLTAARADGIIQAVADADVETTADSGYQGAGGTVRTPIKRPKGKGHNGWEKLANTALARLRGPVERPFATLKRWRVLDRLRISPNRVTDLIHALHAVIQKRSSLARA